MLGTHSVRAFVILSSYLDSCVQCRASVGYGVVFQLGQSYLREFQRDETLGSPREQGVEIKGIVTKLLAHALHIIFSFGKMCVLSGM